VEACRELNPTIHAVFTSTRQLYGKPDYLPLDERHPVRPVDVNGINKLAGEWYHLLYSSIYGIRATVLRLTNTYGPRMRIKDHRQTFVGIWIRRVIEGAPFEVWGGSQIRDFTYVDDCVDALLRSVTSPAAVGKTYNLGGSEPVSLIELADLAVAANGGGSYEIKEFPADRKAIEIGDVRSDYSLIRSELGWQPTVSLTDGLRRTIEYYRPRLGAYL
jgi:UDP-glucose 4-epimerase